MNHENEHGRKLLRMKVEFDVMQVTMEPSQAADNEALTRGTKLLRMQLQDRISEYGKTCIIFHPPFLASNTLILGKVRGKATKRLVTDAG